MNVLGISGTPRINGNSEILLDNALAPFHEAGWEITKILMSENTVNPCKGCDFCENTGICCIDDDMAKIYAAYRACDAVIISSPVYWRNVPAQLKAVFDRTYAAEKSGSLRNKYGGAIAVGRGNGGGQSIVLNIIYGFFLSSGVICVSGELNGVSAVADKPGDVGNQPNRLRQSRVLGENILRVCK